MNRRLYRSRRDSVLGGVCGGVAEYLEVDPSIVRIIWVVLAVVTGGLFLLLYIVMWIVVPEGAAAAPPAMGVAPPPGADAIPASSTPEDGTPPPSAAPPAQAWQGQQETVRRAGSGGPVVVGLALIGLGIWFLVNEYLPAFDRDLVWPAALVILGIALLVISLRRRAQ
jgi:phage shock protein C